MRHQIRLRGISGEAKGRIWESDSLLRAGRLSNLEIILEDSSVSRRHAEIHRSDSSWWLRDLDSTNGTYVNGVRLGSGERQIHPRDIVQFGKVAMMVEMPEASEAEPVPPSSDQIIVEAEASSTWQEGLDRIIHDRNHSPRPGDQLMALLRAGHHLVSIQSEEELLSSILHDAVSVLDAQRGAIVLAEGPEGKLRLKATATGRGANSTRSFFSNALATRCMTQGRSILCCSVEEDDELRGALSIADGAMASVLCVLLRTPRKNLGVIHLDRSYWQRPFTEDDLHLADALAAHVSAGIECAQLMRRQRELFLQTISVMASAIEMRDAYTGGHTARVTNYSLLLADAMKLSAADKEKIQLGGPLHDIGKIGIDDNILRKPDKLTDAEFEKMKSHTVLGDEILRSIPEMVAIRPIVRSHHERWDGRGYPDNLAGHDIDLLARVVAVADSFDAMTTKRPYNDHLTRKVKSAEEAFAEVERCAGTQFDPECAKAFLSVRAEVIQTMQSSRNSGLFSITGLNIGVDRSASTATGMLKSVKRA